MPRNLNDSTAPTVLSMMVSGGSVWGVPPELYYHLYCFEHVEIQVVTAPDSQLLNLQSVSRLVSILDEVNDCRQQTSGA